VDIKYFIFSPSTVVFIGALITAIGAFWKAKQSKKVIFIGTLIVVVGAFWVAAESNKFEDEIKRLNNYILSTITGGDSFCRLSLVSINSSTNNALMCAIPVGEYPLYDVHFTIADLGKVEKMPDDFTYEDFRRTVTNINVGNLAGSCKVLGKLNLGSGDEKKYTVNIIARNGFFTQLIRLKRIEGKWIIATKVMKEEIKVWERIDSAFPRNTAGDVNWN